MKNVLKPGLYEGDNGRMLCHECSGMTAKATGRDLSGRRVVRMTDADDADWMAEIGSPMDCERCKVTRDKVGGCGMTAPYNATELRNSQRADVAALNALAASLAENAAVVTIAHDLAQRLAKGDEETQAFCDAWDAWQGDGPGDPSTDPQTWTAGNLPTWSPSEIEDLFTGDDERINRAQINAAAFSNAITALAYAMHEEA